MAKISDIHAREILDSRGWPTVACEILLDDGTYALGYVPSGASKSASECLELRDEDATRFSGKGVLKAVNNVNSEIRTALIGADTSNLAVIDQRMVELDGTKNKSRLGANAILSVSLAAAKAAAKSQKIPLYTYLASLMERKLDTLTLPIPMMNILNGGKHALGSTDFQEFMIVPTKFPSFKESLRVGTEIFHTLGKILEDRNYQPLVGDEGGYAPSLFSNEQAMELLMLAIGEAGYEAGGNVFIALDPAASRFFSKEGFYELHRENRSLISHELVEFYTMWCDKYPIVSIEDPLDQADWNGWKDITQQVGEKVEIIGDEIYTTNVELLKRGIAEHASTGILIKPNQIGTLTETLETIRIAEDAGFRVVVSNRSGETEDNFIADLAIASGCGSLKSGSPCRSERTAKYNRVLEIEEKNQGKCALAQWQRD